MIYAAAIVTAVCLALAVPLIVQLAIGLFMPWPTPRAHHAFACPRCPCSYESASSLARHHTSQHKHEQWEEWDDFVVAEGIRQEVP